MTPNQNTHVHVRVPKVFEALYLLAAVGVLLLSNVIRKLKFLTLSYVQDTLNFARSKNAIVLIQKQTKNMCSGKIGGP